MRVFQCNGCEHGTCRQDTMDPDCPDPTGPCHFHPENLTVWRELVVSGE